MNSFSAKIDILVVSAHPDDAEMAMGGTLAALESSGLKIHHLVLTRGEMSTYGDVETRMEELKAASKILGCSYEVLDFGDLRIENTPDNRLVVAERIRRSQPKIVFAPYHTNTAAELGGIANTDHYTSGSLVRDAVKLARLEKAVPGVAKHTVNKLYFYMLPRHIRPTIIVDVTEHWERAFMAIRAYRSQMEIVHSGHQIEEHLLAMRSGLGLEIGVQYAEGFVTDQRLNFRPEHFLQV